MKPLNYFEQIIKCQTKLTSLPCLPAEASAKVGAKPVLLARRLVRRSLSEDGSRRRSKALATERFCEGGNAVERTDQL